VEKLDSQIHSASETLPSAAKILQPKDNHLIRSGNFTTASPDFVAKSDYLYDGKQLLEQYVLFLSLLMANLHGFAIANHSLLKFSRVTNIRNTGMLQREILAAGRKEKSTWRSPGRRRAYQTSIISCKDSI